MMNRPSYNKVDKAEREAQLGSHTNVISKSFVTDIWVKVINRAIDDLALYELARFKGKVLSQEEIADEESAKGFLFSDDYAIPMDDYVVDVICNRCEGTWQDLCSKIAGQDCICPHCKKRINRKYIIYDITLDQRVSETTLAELISIWGVHDIKGFREGVQKRINETVQHKIVIFNEAQMKKAKSEFEKDLDVVLNDFRAMLLDKNKKYGDSALEPVRIFSKADAREQIRVRMDDKLSRMIRGDKDNDDEDPLKDLVGYYFLEQIAKLREDR